MSSIDWLSIKNEYVSTNISYRKLALKHNISFSVLEKKARFELWKNERDKQGDKIATKVRQKTEDAIVKKEVDRIGRIATLADRLIDKLELATEQLDNYIVTNKRKVKTITYDNEVHGKPAKEVTTETEELAIIDGIIDRQGLKQLASALKNIKDVQIVSVNNDGQLEKLDDVLDKIGGVI